MSDLDIVYIYRRSFSREIEWSIKSLKNIAHRNVYVVGDDPKVSGVTVIKPLTSNWSRYSEYHDQMNKYLTAALTPEISTPFLAFNDDFFCMEPWEPKYYHREPLGEHMKWRKRMDNYQRGLNITHKYLLQKQKSTRNYELHIPMLFEKDKLVDLINSIPMQRHFPFQIRSLYGNFYNVESEYMEDVKNVTDFRDRPLLSTNEQTFLTGEIGNYIREMLS